VAQNTLANSHLTRSSVFDWCANWTFSRKGRANIDFIDNLSGSSGDNNCNNVAQKFV